ncbi:hypothetical protein ACFRMQ_05655 [Kitasatospora sp. NPDC056783]|uniref:hypothetical protein n=1 Tax=Kitasatospora sp. NPDC056783 TaxID=3345943 RepID=UPI0036B072F1
MSTYFITVLADVHEGREKDFHAWYENKHIPEILEVPGIVSVRRMTLNENQIAADESHSQDHYGFLTLIEIETEDFDTTLDGISKLDGSEVADFLIPGRILASLYRDPKLYTRH